MVTSEQPVQGMGEFLLYDTAEKRWLEAAEIGGHLNSNFPIPKHLSLHAVLYRVDKMGRKSVLHMPVEEQRPILEQIASLHKDWDPPELIKVTEKNVAKHAMREEGLVGVPRGRSIVDAGRKLKIREPDPYDWQITAVDLAPGPKGGIEGVVRFISLQSGREYKVGGGPLGPMERRLDMMKHPERWIGKAVKVRCHKGHEGRAAHVIGEHLDKGLGD